MLTTPQVTRRRDTGVSGRRPASAARVGTRAAVRAGMSAATVAAATPMRATAPTSDRRSVVAVEPLVEEPLDQRLTDQQQRRPPAPSPTRAPTTPVTVPCSTSAVRTVRGGRAARRQLAERDELPASADRERGRDHDPDDGEHDRAQHEAPAHRLRRPSSRCWSRRMDSSRTVRFPPGCASSSLAQLRQGQVVGQVHEQEGVLVRVSATSLDGQGPGREHGRLAAQAANRLDLAHHGGRRASGRSSTSSSPTSTPSSSASCGREDDLAVASWRAARHEVVDARGERVVERQVGQLGVRARTVGGLQAHPGGRARRTVREPSGRSALDVELVPGGVGLAVGALPLLEGRLASVRMRVTAMAMPATGRATSSATSAVRPGRRRTSRRASRRGSRQAAHPETPDGPRRPGTTSARRWPRRRCGRRA